MGNGKLKIGIVCAVLAAAVVWLGMSGWEDSRAYYKTVDEYARLDSAGQSRRIRLMGDVAKGSITRESGALVFALTLNGATVPVVYRGTDPVPDTFKEGAQALVEGSRGVDGRFAGRQIQAKCASKYEAESPASAYGPSARAGAPGDPTR